MEWGGLLSSELRGRIPVDVLPELEAWIARLFQQFQERLAESAQRNLVLEERLSALEDRLNKNSSNSSKPPSSDGPEVKRAPPKPKSKRKRGGQPGHAKKERAILEPTQTIIRKPTHCSSCQSKLTGNDPEPELFQYLDLPPILPKVIHFLLHRLKCACGCINRGQVPEDIIGHDGPGILAMVVSLLGRHLSRRQVAEFMQTVCGVPMSAGNVCKIQNRTTNIFAPTVQEVRTELRKKNNNIDETGLCQSNKAGWLWAAVSQAFASYWVRLSRGKDVFEEIIGPNYKNICTTDRLRTYAHLGEDRHQFCWAHLLRDFQAMIDRKNSASTIGRRLLVYSKRMFQYWFQVRDGTLSFQDFSTEILTIRNRITKALADGCFATCAKTAGCCNMLIQDENKMWTFAKLEGVEPTNNAAERALRKAAIWRRIMLGTQSESGNRFVETILTLWETCRKQGRNSYQFLRNTFEAAAQHQPIPSLVPANA